jgi:hypothetical protein
MNSIGEVGRVAAIAEDADLSPGQLRRRGVLGHRALPGFGTELPAPDLPAAWTAAPAGSHLRAVV